MGDPRVKELARILVHHSIDVQPGEKILIMGDAETAPLIKEVYRSVLKAGGHPMLQVGLAELNKIMYDEASSAQLDDVDVLEWLYHRADGLIRILGSANNKELTNVDPEKLKQRSRATSKLSRYLMQGGAKWVLTMFPTQAQAQDADMSLEEYEHFVYSATNVDYAAMERSMLGAIEKFNAASKVRIVGKETDLTVDIAGRSAVICAGNRNVPDGEFYFSPNHLLTEGHIYYEWPTIYNGREISGIRLRFEKGRVVDSSAEKGEEALAAALDTDEGARFLGELGIGVNYGITRPTKDILFDEKIGGSVHLALGRAYEMGGAGNESDIHWDMVKNLKDGGEIYLDGVLVQKNGQWVF
ncbi:aminopeptidase [Paenibacillus sambharensis]|uniref:Aminopeptidase n=1 Tax=Paenibacillus sambharensis TaxID=1803190 RepID=A0A2W1LJM9_9BACL|nr:aminopeptidase [Paenibacillus sambharensis]PZD95115.1 aminopeptidase [Paenibacillus sambharensis]